MKGGIMKSGFLEMIFSVLGIVLYCTLFGTIMTSLVALLATSGISSLTLLSTVVGITPTVLLLAGTVGAGYAFVKGQQKSGASDPGGIMRMVLGVLMLVLFITLFGTITTAFVSLYTTYGSNTTWVAFGTVVTIVPVILYLGGIFGAISTGYQGYKARRSRHALA